jgi:hypothetical protein
MKQDMGKEVGAVQRDLSVLSANCAKCGRGLRGSERRSLKAGHAKGVYRARGVMPVESKQQVQTALMECVCTGPGG